MGFMISFAGNITFPKAQQIRDTAKEVPLERHLDRNRFAVSRSFTPGANGMNRRTWSKRRANWVNYADFLLKRSGEQTAKNFYHFFSLPEKADSI